MPARESAHELLERARARLEKERRATEGGVGYWKAANPGQAAAIAHPGSLLLIGGNQSGKTCTGAVKTIHRMLGKDAPMASRVWCVSQTLPGVGDKPHVQLDMVKQWIPREALRGGSWAKAWSPGARVLTLAQGQKAEFKSYDQDLLSFESAAVDYIWFDEEPTRKEIFTSCLMRLVARGGRWLMTLTPVLSLQGQGAIAEQLWDQRDDPDIDYGCVQLFTADNPHLPEVEVAKLQRLPEEERQVRLYGAFARVGGRVLSEFDPGRHLARQEFLPPREWRHYLVIDPGWNKAGHLFAAVDPGGRIWLYAEHYQGEWRPEQHMAVLHGMWSAFGKPEYDVLMDPAGFSIKRTSTGRESPSDAAEYVAAATRLGAAWFNPRPANNGDAYAWRVKRYLQSDLMRVFPSLTWWRWEQERWTRQRERDGAAARERAIPDRPIDRHNHLMDPTRYLCNELPDPLPQPEPLPFSAAAEHWRAELEAAEGQRGGAWV